MNTKSYANRMVWSLIGLLAFGSPSFADGHHHNTVAGDLARAAKTLLAALDSDQRANAAIDWDSDMREGWYFVPDRFIKAPGKRSGVAIRDMNQKQRLLAHALLGTALSHKGYQQATTIMALEAVLHDMENSNPIRDPELYYFTFFGEPSADKTWSWRCEGHHLSINMTLVGGRRISVTPSFFGTNPAEIPGGSLKGLRVLAHEEDLARGLVKSLDSAQRNKAILSDQAPADIITSQDRKVNKGLFFPAKGIPFTELNEGQRNMLIELVKQFVMKHRHEVLEQVIKRAPVFDPQSAYFAWAGGLERGDGHYFRVQTDRYLFEYDNTQNGANHAHAVWRDFDGDFGADLLREHYDESH